VSRLLLALGVVALTGALVLALSSRPPADVGEALSAPSTGPSTATFPPSAVPEPTGSGARATSPSPTAPAPARVGTRSARLSDQEVTTPPAPVRLVVPAIGVDVPVEPVGVDPDGQMTVPTDVGRAGWYRHGPAPADAVGSVVLAGHVDSRSQGRGAFFDLADLAPGDEVRVTDEAGDTTSWTVTGRRTIPKERLPLEEVFRRDGPSRLVLVTCGGDFDAGRRSYRSNVVVTAEPRP
jgi:sortase (surface protein transpeptidase)